MVALSARHAALQLRSMAYCVGLTGGIGCGKSTVAQAFADLGAALIDTDAISHALTQPGASAYQKIVDQFGPSFVLPQGALDRAKLRALIFSDNTAKAKLESILHPLIHAQVLSTLDHCGAPYALLVVPLLFETRQYLALVQRTLVVDCSEDSQIARTMARSHLSEVEVRAIMAHQLARSERLQQAEDVIRNESNFETLQLRVAALHMRYSAFAQAVS